MDATPQITVALKPEMVRSGLKMNSLKPGHTLLLKVLELRGDRALIDFGNFRATADIKVPVGLGEELLARVQESGKQLTLSLLNPELKSNSVTDSAPRLLEMLSDDVFKKFQGDINRILSHSPESPSAKAIPVQIINILKGISSHFEAFDLTKVMAELLPRLKSYVDNSGLFFEKMLETVIAKLMEDSQTASTRQLANHPAVLNIVKNDLKANLFILKNYIENEATLQKAFDARTFSVMRKAVDGLLADIANQQGRAVKQLDLADPFQVFTYTLPLEEEKQAARLKIYYQKNQKQGAKNGFQVSLLLSMDRLGKLRTDFYLLDKDLTITFFVKDQSIKTRIQDNYPELQELLNPFFNQTLVRVIVSEKKIKEFDHEDVPLTSDRRVDVRI